MKHVMIKEKQIEIERLITERRQLAAAIERIRREIDALHTDEPAFLIEPGIAEIIDDTVEYKDAA